MRNSKAVYSEILAGIKLNESDDEKKAIATAVMDSLFGLSFSAIFADVPLRWTPEVAARVEHLLSQLNAGEPVQYVTGEAYFLGRKFLVDRNVLIPRPETEELVREVLAYAARGDGARRVVDVGTGSGCIAVSVALQTKGEIFATDVSEEALEVARSNARKLGASVTFLRHDILEERLSIGGVDILVSNPPYIPHFEKEEMSSNVLDFEPHLALFVSDEDPLTFYRRISAEGRRCMVSGGMIIFECNARFANDVARLLKESGFIDTEVIRDISGNERIVKAFQP